MTNDEATALREKIDNSPGLKILEQRLTTELLPKEEQNGYGIDPLTILFVISVIIQVISLCINVRSKAEVEIDMANAYMLPPRKLMRLKRRLNVLWNEHCQKTGIDPGKTNPFFTAAVSAVRGMSREDVTSVVQAVSPN